MNKGQKQAFVRRYAKRTEEFTEEEWSIIEKEYNITPNDVMKNINKKYQFKTENNEVRSFVYTISNGNAFDCPALHCCRCNVPCYGLKGSFTWNDTKVNKEFQRIILNFVPVNYLFFVVKHHATNKRKNPLNRLRFLRLNEVSDFTQSLIDRMTVLSQKLYNDVETRHIKIFSYTKMQHLNFSDFVAMPNVTVNNSQVINPLYSNGNVFIAVDKEFYDSIVETDIVKKCDCEINCHGCELCYSNGGYIIFCLIH